MRREKYEEIKEMGVKVSHKVGTAVVRNRVRRWIKENYRLMEPCLARGYNIVLVARKPSAHLRREGAYAQIGDAMKRLLGKHGLLGSFDATGDNRDDTD
jgi:ribonuclease P protein component